MLEGFTVGEKYVVEEKLVGGRLLCHDLGVDGNKRIIPLGTLVKNKLYSDVSESAITMYDGVKIQVYDDSILTCLMSDSGDMYFEGIFYTFTDCSGFCEGGIYFYKGLDHKGNIFVEDKQSRAIKKIPKGVVLSPDEYQQWTYNGVNTEMPKEGSEFWCTSIRDDIVFVGDFKKKDDLVTKVDGARCPNCNSIYTNTQLGFQVNVKYSGVFKVGSIGSESCTRFDCPNCGAIILKAEDRVGKICIGGGYGTK